MKLLILNGPNLNLLGLREPDIYGRQNYAALVRFCEDTCREADISCKVFQSNHEGALVDEIQAACGVFDGIVINAEGEHTLGLDHAVQQVDLLILGVLLDDRLQRGQDLLDGLHELGLVAMLGSDVLQNAGQISIHNSCLLKNCSKIVQNRMGR